MEMTKNELGIPKGNWLWWWWLGAMLSVVFYKISQIQFYIITKWYKFKPIIRCPKGIGRLIDLLVDGNMTPSAFNKMALLWWLFHEILFVLHENCASMIFSPNQRYKFSGNCLNSGLHEDQVPVLLFIFCPFWSFYLRFTHFAGFFV